MWTKGQGAPQTHAYFQASFEIVNLIMALKDIPSIVLGSCPDTALVRMTFGWSMLDSFHPIFLSQFFKNLQKSNLDGRSWITTFLATFSSLKSKHPFKF
jgi:hypothetical protein